MRITLGNIDSLFEGGYDKLQGVGKCVLRETVKKVVGNENLKERAIVLMTLIVKEGANKSSP